LGFAWLPTTSIEQQLETQQLRPLRLNRNSKRSGQLYLVFKDVDRLGPAAKCFLAELREQCLSINKPDLQSN
jgi:DNA-binding transcriptional LysR family regulator